jgi:hypothetical protein
LLLLHGRGCDPSLRNGLVPVAVPVSLKYAV